MAGQQPLRRRTKLRLTRGKIIGLVAGVLAVVLAGGAYLFGVSSAAKAGSGHGPSPEEKPAPGAPGPMYVLKDQVVNLADPTGRRYLKIGLSIEFSTGAAEFKKAGPEERKAKQAEFDKSLEPMVPLINDAIIGILAARSPSEISTPEGKQRLKNDIKDALNRILGGDQVANVYFTQFVMQ